LKIVVVLKNYSTIFEKKIEGYICYCNCQTLASLFVTDSLRPLPRILLSPSLVSRTRASPLLLIACLQLSSSPAHQKPVALTEAQKKEKQANSGNK